MFPSQKISDTTFSICISGFYRTFYSNWTKLYNSVP
jgi:hypothetical protein